DDSVKPPARKEEVRRIQVRSVKPTNEEAVARRSFVQAYGLTYKDLERISSLPAVHRVLPLRIFPHEIRRLARLHLGRVIAGPPELAEGFGLQLASGRFLSAEDDQERKNVVVLGAIAAQTLFPDGDAVGKSVNLNRQAFLVVGVLTPHDGTLGSLDAEQAD